MNRQKELKEIVSKLDEDKRKVLAPLLIDIEFLEGRLEELRRLPHIRVDTKNPAKQQITPAGKQYKEMMQSYINAVKVIVSALNKVESSAADELLERLKEFEI